MQKKITKSIQDAVRAVEQLASFKNIIIIEKIAYLLADAFAANQKLLIAGNGGSLCDAAHCAEELVGIFRKPRAALPALALSDSGYLSCVGNDLGFERVFARGIEAYGHAGDIFLGLTTSGNSANLVAAFEVAKERGLKTVALLGRGGGLLSGVADIELSIEGFSTSDRIQEAHMVVLHTVVEMVEELLFYSPSQFEMAHAVAGGS